jgi:hypothetical protein
MQKLYRKSKHTFYVHQTFFFFENRAVYEIKWKNLYSRRGHRRQYGACAFHAGYLRLQTHSEYVLFIAFLLQQWLQVCASCYVIRTLPILFKTSLCTNTHSHRSRNTNLPNYSSYVALQSKRCMDYIPPQRVPKVRPMLIFISSS